MGNETLSIDQLQRDQIRTLKQQLFVVTQKAARLENDNMHLRGELTFVQGQNETLVLKLQHARRTIDAYKNAVGFKIPNLPEEIDPAEQQVITNTQ